MKKMMISLLSLGFMVPAVCASSKTMLGKDGHGQRVMKPKGKIGKVVSSNDAKPAAASASTIANEIIIKNNLVNDNVVRGTISATSADGNHSTSQPLQKIEAGKSITIAMPQVLYIEKEGQFDVQKHSTASKIVINFTTASNKNGFLEIKEGITNISIDPEDLEGAQSDASKISTAKSAKSIPAKGTHYGKKKNKGFANIK